MGSILDSDVRSDLVAAHRGVADALAQPGTWWTAAERVAMAAEVRRAAGHRDRPPWEAPSSLGLTGADDRLPSVAVDAVWRIANHPGTLTREWCDGIVGELPSAEHYVELVAVVAITCAVDRLAELLALDPIPLPEPQSGEPSRRRVDGAAVSTHWVPTAGESGPMVLRALSAVPADAAVRTRLSEAQYVPAAALMGDLSWGRPTIDRRQIELLAAQTSLVNDCFY